MAACSSVGCNNLVKQGNAYCEDCSPRYKVGRINSRFVDVSNTAAGINEVKLFLLVELSSRTGRTYELGDVELGDVKLLHSPNEIRLTFELKDETRSVTREAHWPILDLLAYEEPVTRLITRELEEALVELVKQDEKKVLTILRKAVR